MQLTIKFRYLFIYSEITGIPEPSRRPWPFMWHKGGGIIIPCRYIIFFERKNLSTVRIRLQQSIEFIPGGSISQDD